MTTNLAAAPTTNATAHSTKSWLVVLFLGSHRTGSYQRRQVWILMEYFLKPIGELVTGPVVFRIVILASGISGTADQYCYKSQPGQILVVKNIIPLSSFRHDILSGVELGWLSLLVSFHVLHRCPTYLGKQVSLR